MCSVLLFSDLEEKISFVSLLLNASLNIGKYQSRLFSNTNDFFLHSQILRFLQQTEHPVSIICCFPFNRKYISFVNRPFWPVTCLYRSLGTTNVFRRAFFPPFFKNVPL